MEIFCKKNRKKYDLFFLFVFRKIFREIFFSNFFFRYHGSTSNSADSADVRYESEHKKGQFEPAEVGKIAEKHFSS
jgi:hypothetical protein